MEEAVNHGTPSGMKRRNAANYSRSSLISVLLTDVDFHAIADEPPIDIVALASFAKAAHVATAAQSSQVGTTDERRTTAVMIVEDVMHTSSNLGYDRVLYRPC
jgi:hypothetical protein